MRFDIPSCSIHMQPLLRNDCFLVAQAWSVQDREGRNSCSRVTKRRDDSQGRLQDSSLFFFVYDNFRIQKNRSCSISVIGHQRVNKQRNRNRCNLQYNYYLIQLHGYIYRAINTTLDSDSSDNCCKCGTRSTSRSTPFLAYIAQGPVCLPVERHYGRSLNRQQGVGFVLKSVQRTALAISRPHRRAEGQKVTPTLNGSRHSLFLE
ncbi:hypothetical protein CEXT_341 [Caerostris extrusa]|uniref:Uncharacterized protein n=1 Tax=Caerostris extrusa TaxID=172846 RepID=A0AAV4SJJ4_CAEEX|nr:hypothetical protein CEXT_341 [Caerostris extrusa]